MMKKLVLGLTVCCSALIEVNCMNQRYRTVVGGVDEEFFQRQWDLQQSPAAHFSNDELKCIYNETSKSKMNMNVPEDQHALMPYVFSGNPRALYEFAQRDGGQARLAYNDEKRKLLIERGILLLIAAVCGEHRASKESLDFAAEAPIDYNNLNSLDSIIAEAKHLEPNL